MIIKTMRIVMILIMITIVIVIVLHKMITFTMSCHDVMLTALLLSGRSSPGVMDQLHVALRALFHI